MHGKKIRLSVVIAVYNLEKYIFDTIENLQKVDFEGIEFLIINDGSIDKSQEIIEEKIKNDDRFFLINKTNGGLSDARNTGIKNSKGKYICFLDGDDLVEKTLYNKLFEAIEKDNEKLVICNFKKVYSKKIKIYKTNIKNYNEEFYKNFFKTHDENYVVVWNKIFVLEKIKKNNIFFENKAFFEDIGFILRYLKHVSGIKYINEVLINYIQREGSITRTYNNEIFKSYNNILKIMKDNNINVDDFKLLKVRLQIYIYMYLVKSKYKKEYLVDYLENNYIIKLPLKHIVFYFYLKTIKKIKKRD